MTIIKHQPYDMTWTLAEMWDFEAHPYMERIVRFIEPKITRGIFLPCWLWSGRHQYFNRGSAHNEYMYPTVNMPIDINNPDLGRKVVYVHRFMAETFFHVEPGEIVYHVPECQYKNCVNPAHLVVSHRNDPEFS